MHSPFDVRSRLEDGARELGHDPAILLRPFAAGKPPSAERERRDVLAVLVHRLHVDGALLTEVSTAIGISKQRVSELARRGRALVDGNA